MRLSMAAATAFLSPAMALSRPSRLSLVPMARAASSNSRPAPMPTSGAPGDSVRIVAATPAAWCASSAPAAPISTSPGCAPIASTLSVASADTGLSWPISPVILAAKSAADMGFWTNSVPGCRMALNARSIVACAVITTTGSVGSSRRRRSRNSSPVMRGISISVITRSQCSASICCSPVTGSGTCLTSCPRDPSTLVAHRPKSRSSSTSRIRPEGFSGVESSISALPAVRATVPRPAGCTREDGRDLALPRVYQD